jgi:hypothetical protein
MPAGAVVRPRTMCWSEPQIFVVTTLENNSVVDRLSCWIAEGRKVDLLNFDAAGFEVNHAPIGIGRHLQSSLGLTLGSIST